MIPIKDIKYRLNQFLPELHELRRHLHAHPELSGEENLTASLIANELRTYGWRVKEGVGKTGIVAEIGDTNKPLVGLRVDMDALPIEEKTDLVYSSLREGVMHACGHDFHICIGLGVARLLSEYPITDAGIRLLFQPAEEIAEGAKWMRSDGATKGLDALFGVHVFPDLPVGTIGVRTGNLTAAAGELEIEVIGESGHGARPHQSIDAIWIASRVIGGLQEAIARKLDALNPLVISFGRIEGGRAFNVIADRVKLLGTVRCLDETLHESLPSWIENIVQGIASSFGAKATVHYRCIAPIVVNDAHLTNFLELNAKLVIGAERVLRLEKPSLGAEDFAEFLQDVPGTMFRLGVSGENGCAPLHSGFFSPDESSLEIGVHILAKTLMEWVNNQSSIAKSGL